MRKLAALLVTTLVCFITIAAHADTLKGSGVRAQLIFLNDPNYCGCTGLPTNQLTGNTGFHDTLTQIGTGQEYSHDDGIATYTANFNKDATQLTIRVNCDTGVSLKNCNKEPGFEFIFKDEDFVNFLFTPDPSDFLTGALPAGVLGIEDGLFVIAPLSSAGGGADMTLKNSKFIVDISPIPAPEPGSIVLLSTGALAMAGAARRRLKL